MGKLNRTKQLQKRSNCESLTTRNTFTLKFDFILLRHEHFNGRTVGALLAKMTEKHRDAAFRP